MELWMDDDYLCMIMVFVNVFLLIMVIWFCVNFFYNKLTITILYCVMGTYDDREPSFVGTDEQQ